MSRPALHSLAPDFTAPFISVDHPLGGEVTLSALRGRPVVLYFYPKDDTPGCTRQACFIRDAWQKVTRRAHLFGISTDSLRSHDRFIKKFGLPFPLIADEDKAIAQAYGVWVEKTLYGRKYMGMERSSFIIDKEGCIKAILEKVKPEEHLDLLQAAL